MSLLSIISDKPFQELRDKFKTVFPRPSIKLTGNLLAPPLTANYSVLGQAIDYLIRFTLEHRYKEKVNSSGGWVADTSYLMITKPIEKSTTSEIRIGRNGDIKVNRKKFLEMLRHEYTLAKENYEQFITDGIYTNSLIQSALFLARLDVTFRAKMIDPNLGNESEDDIQDIRKMLSLITNEHFIVEKLCFVNPTFGIGSQLVGGADADLIIDDLLIDIKATKNLVIERENLNQLIGYYVLSMIGGVNKEIKLRPIKNIGIYFARYGILWKIPIKDIANEKAVLEFKNWFFDYVDDNLWEGQFKKLIKPVKKRTKVNSKRQLKIKSK